MLIGTAWHEGVFEPEVFAGRYVSYHKARNLNHAEYQEFLALEDVSHEHVFTERSLAEVHDLIASANRSPVIQWMKESGAPEKVIFWTDPRTGVKCRCKLDWADPDRFMVGEGKTILSVYGDTIAREAGKRGYWFQAVHNLDGFCMATRGTVVDWDDPEFDIPIYPFVFTGKDSSHKTVARVFTREEMQKAAKVRQGLLSRVAKCVETGIWPGVSQDLSPIELSKWAIPDVA
ncbi:MAG: PD-(D/E)XK nuclease-like domain-containing protein [Planctomycetes bacterium]|nr:PD-(D/E)XK nuclease-like domain-containing protein [Planctomycetota bacterium]